MDRARIRDDWLAIAAIAYLVANLLHGADHIRQELAGVNVVIAAGGAMLTAAGVAAVIVALRHEPRTPLVATVVGFIAAILVAASHVAPHWSVLSDSYIDDVHPDALSWAVVLLEITTAAFLGSVGLYRVAWRAQGTFGNHGAPRSGR
jgi:hypothetical protein